MLTDQLCNPTPWNVSFNYHRGEKLNIPADGAVKLTHDQLQDFRTGTPGHEGVRNIMEMYGLFLLDGERSYDEQALEAISATLKEKQKRLDEFVTRTQDQRLATGRPIDDQTMTKLMESSGYDKIKEQVEQLSERKEFLRGRISDASVVRDRIDPRVTCLATDPPRTFPSETALQMFLKSNPELAEQHNKIAEALLAEEE
jgi:hypothetical protein